MRGVQVVDEIGREAIAEALRRRGDRPDAARGHSHITKGGQKCKVETDIPRTSNHSKWTERSTGSTVQEAARVALSVHGFKPGSVAVEFLNPSTWETDR